MPDFVGGIKFPVPGDAYNSAYGEPQWWKDLAETASAQIATKAEVGHSHSWAQVTGKPSTFPPSSHTHAWGEVTGKPSTYPPESHSHSGISNGAFTWSVTSAGAIAANAGGSNTWQIDANSGRLIAGDVPWARISDAPVTDYADAIAALNAAAA